MTDWAEALRGIALFLMLYAALTGWRFGLRLRSERAKRRAGLLLNLARRAGPPVVGGALAWAVGLAIARPEVAGVAGLLVFGGAAFGLTRGLQEMRQDTRMLLGLRVGASLGLTLAVIWLRTGV
jgi:hypothetical protein